MYGGTYGERTDEDIKRIYRRETYREKTYKKHMGKGNTEEEFTNVHSQLDTQNIEIMK